MVNHSHQAPDKSDLSGFFLLQCIFCNRMNTLIFLYRNKLSLCNTQYYFYLICPQPVDNLWKNLNNRMFYFFNSVISYKLKEYEFGINQVYQRACGKLGEKFNQLNILFHVKQFHFIQFIAHQTINCIGSWNEYSKLFYYYSLRNDLFINTKLWIRISYLIDKNKSGESYNLKLVFSI